MLWPGETFEKPGKEIFEATRNCLLADGEPIRLAEFAKALEDLAAPKTRDISIGECPKCGSEQGATLRTFEELGEVQVACNSCDQVIGWAFSEEDAIAEARGT